MIANDCLASENLAKDPAVSEVVVINHTTIAELNPLSAIVYPCEINVKGGLDYSEYNRNRLGWAIVEVQSAPDPIEDVEGAVGTESQEVIRVNNRRNRSLSEQDQLRQYANRLQDNGKGPAELHETPVSLLLEYHHDERRRNQTTTKTKCAKFPCLLTLSSARIHTKHDKQDVEGRENVEYLEDEVPPGVNVEEIEVARAEDKGVESLGDQRHTLARLVTVDGNYEDAFREGVGDVPQDAEYLCRTLARLKARHELG